MRERAPNRHRLARSPDRKKLMLVPVEQRHVPLQHASESLVAEGARRDIAAEEHGQVDVGLGRDATQERRLVLDRMRDQIGQPYRWIEAHLTRMSGSGLLRHLVEEARHALLESFAAKLGQFGWNALGCIQGLAQSFEDVLGIAWIDKDA